MIQSPSCGTPMNNKWSAAGTDERSSAAVDMLLLRLSSLGLRDLEQLALLVERRLQDFDQRVEDEEEFRRVRGVVQQEFESIVRDLAGVAPDNPPTEILVADTMDRLTSLERALSLASGERDFYVRRKHIEAELWLERASDAQPSQLPDASAHSRGLNVGKYSPPRAQIGYPTEIALLLGGLILIGVRVVSEGLPTPSEVGVALALIVLYAAAKRLWHHFYVRRTWQYQATADHAHVYRDAVGLYLLQIRAM
jgi:hypothetical protein